MSDEDPDEDENSLLGDKTHIRKTLVRHIVASIMADVSDGRRFEQLDILELGAGDGFFVRSYAEVYAENGRGDLPNLVQTDANPQHSDVPRHAADTYASARYARGAGQLAEGPDSLRVVELDVSELSSLQPDELAARLGGKRAFDAVVSVDFLSCLAFGAGLDPDEPDDADALGQLDHGLCGVLRPGGHYYDFMAVAPNSQFILRFVPDYCSAHPGRFICVLNDDDDDGGGGDGGGSGSGGGSGGGGGGSSGGGSGGGGGGGSDEAERDTLLFVTFDTSALRHEDSAAGDGPMLRVPGYPEPFTYSALLDELSRPRRGERSRAPLTPESRAFATKVLEFLFRDINSGGCADNWELLSYVSVDPAHFDEVFDEGEHLLPVFLHTFRRAVRFLRDALKRSRATALDHALEELSVVDAFAATAAANLTRHAVESTAVDVPGVEGALYMQRYHTAHVSGEGEPDGHGSFRCLTTKASRAQSD